VPVDSPVGTSLEGYREIPGRQNGVQGPAGTYGHEYRPCFGEISFLQA